MVFSSILPSKRSKDSRYALSTLNQDIIHRSLFQRASCSPPQEFKTLPTTNRRSEIRFTAIKTNGLIDSLCESRTIFLSALRQIERDK